jgi:hypothetical protein
MGVCLWFVSSWKQLSAPLAICSQLQLVCSVVHHGVVYFRATCISVCHPCEIRICKKVSAKISLWKSSQQTNNSLLRDKKQKHKHRVLTEEKFDTIGARLEHTPGKLLKYLAQETWVSKSSARTATQLLKPSTESGCPVCCKYKKDCCTCFLMKQLIPKNTYVLRGQHLQHLLWSVNLNFFIRTLSHVRHADSSAKFVCASQQGAHQLLWSAEPWTQSTH